MIACLIDLSKKNDFSLSNDYKITEDEVLSVYRKVSPSIINLNSEQEISTFFTRRLNILKTLGLPTQLFQNKKLLDIGGGTGEKSLIYALLGADVTIVEPNEKSCQYTKKLFANFIPDSTPTIINKSLFEFDTSIIKNFDIIISEGVVHHTFDPIAAMNILLKNLSENTVVMIGLGESHAWFKRELQRKLIRKLSKGNEHEIVKISKKYFQTHLDRTVKFGSRSEKTIIYDTWVNPQSKHPTLKEICNCFKDNHVSHLSSYPTLENPYHTNSWSSPTADKFDYEYYKGYYEFLEKVWMTSGEENFEKDIGEFEFMKIKTRINSDYLQLLELEKKCIDESFNDDELELLQNGYLGIGMNYFVGVKQSDNFLSVLDGAKNPET
jgi:SAM-dependent methyltransferase